MAIESGSRPRWAEELLEKLSEPAPEGVFDRRRRAAERILANRVDIRPDSAAAYIRAIREEEDEG